MFDFLMDLDNYEDRKVARLESDSLIIDTAKVSDGERPFETAVSHLEYNDGSWIIVEAYNTKEEAQAGHDRWVKIMTRELPPSLTDCQNAKLVSGVDRGSFVYPRKVGGVSHKEDNE